MWRSVILSNANYLASLLTALIINLALPLVMVKGQFADVRAFLLFAGYGGLLHFGLLDGFYLSVVGSRLLDLPLGYVRTIRRVVLVLQLAAVGSVVLLCRLVPILQENQRIALPSVLLASMTCYLTIYAYLLQGTGRFWTYVRVNVATTLFALVGILGLVAIGRASYVAVAVLYVLSALITILIFELWWLSWARTNRGYAETGGRETLTATWHRGFVLFSASAFLLLLFSIDKLTVAIRYPKSDFAEYAFAAGIVGILYLALDALAYAINPFIGGVLRMGNIDARKFRLLLVSLVWFAPAIYWPAVRGVMEAYPHYETTPSTLRALMASIPSIVVFRAWVIPAVRASGLEMRLLMISGCAVAVSGGAIMVAVHLGAESTAVAWVWSFVAVLLGLGSLLLIGSGVESLAGPARMSLMVNASAASILFLTVSRDPGWIAMTLYALLGGAVVAATLNLNPASRMGFPR